MTTVHMDPRLRARRIEVLRLRGRRRLRWVALVVAVVVTAASAWWTLTATPLFDVDELLVRGTTNTSAESVAQASGITLGQPLVEVDTGAARVAIAALPWVLEVSSDRSAGGRVTFTVTERTPVAAVAGSQGWLLVDGYGRVLDSVASVPSGLVVLDGLGETGPPGTWLEDSALWATEVARLMPVGLASKVAVVVLTDQGLELELFGGAKVLFGDVTELDSKFLAALTLLVRVDIECLASIDVRAPTVPVLTRLADCP